MVLNTKALVILCFAGRAASVKIGDLSDLWPEELSDTPKQSSSLIEKAGGDASVAGGEWYVNTGTKVCAGTRTAYWDNRESQQHRFQNGAILNPLFKKGNGNRVELDNACRTLCSKDVTCGGYAIATDRFWRTSHWGHPHNYVCALYGDCKASKAENGNYHGFQKL